MARNLLEETAKLLITPSLTSGGYFARILYMTNMYFLKIIPLDRPSTNSNLPRQIDLINQTDWRILIVMDAARYDYVQLVGQKLGLRFKPVVSQGSITIDWFLNTWCKTPLGKKIIYLSANPFIRSRNRAESACVRRIVDLWQRLWEPELGTVLTHKVLSNALIYVRLHKNKLIKDKERIVIHLLQPHAPYLGWPKSLQEIWRHGAPKNIDEIYKIFLKNKKIIKIIKRAYLASIFYTLTSIKEFVKRIKNIEPRISVVITADHGELLSEYNLLFHPNIDVKTLRVIPWLYIK